MKSVDKSFIIKPSFVRLTAYLGAIQFPIYLVAFGLINKCELASECVASAISEDWMMIVFIILITAISSRRLYVIEIGGENSLASNVLKGFGNRRIDLSKEYTVKIVRRSIKLAQDKSSIIINRLIYSKEDVDSLFSILKI